MQMHISFSYCCIKKEMRTSKEFIVREYFKTALSLKMESETNNVI